MYLVIRAIPVVSSSTNKTSIARFDSIQVMHNLDCYIIRSEKLIMSNMEGSIKYFVQQGEKVEKGYKVVEISKDIIDESTRKKLEVVNQRIESLNNDENLLFESDINRLNYEIMEITNNLREYANRNELLKMASLEKELRNKLEKKRIIAGDKSFAGKNMESLKQEQQQLEKRINDSIGMVHSPESGIISYYIDGYESILNPNNIEILELDKLLNIDQPPKDLRSSYVIHNQPLFKVIDNHLWYMITWVNHDVAQYYKAGKSVVFKFPKADIKGKINKVIENEDKDMIIFETNEYINDFLLSRNLKIDVVAVNYEGLKIYKDSIVEIDNRQGVFVLDINRFARFKPIEVIGMDDEFAVVRSNVFYEKDGEKTKAIETIKLYDEIVRKADKIKEGQLVN